MPLDEAIGRLKTHEERVKAGDDVEPERLLFSHSEWGSHMKKQGVDKSRSTNWHTSSEKSGSGRSNWRGRGRGRGGPSGQNVSRQIGESSQGARRDKRKGRCFNCHMHGHYASECRNKKHNEEVNLSKAQDEEPALMMAVLEDQHVMLHERNVVPELLDEHESVSYSNEWYLDNGASNHMTGDVTKFHELDEKVGGVIKFGDGSTVTIQGKGSVLFKCKNGEQRLMKGVYFIPKLKNNIISLGQMTEQGSKVMLDGVFLKVYDRNEALLMKVRRSPNRLYKIVLDTCKPVCLLSKLTEPAWLWHTRLGHVNFYALDLMTKKNMVYGVPRIEHPNQLCESCLVAKQTRFPFPAHANYRASEKLELVHGDLCGPITPETLGGNKYFMLLVDDLTRYMWVYMLKSKDETYEAFKKFKAMVEKEGKHKLRTLRTDRGGEFTSKLFTELCEKEGIQRHLTAPYSPQQNGVVERRNRTVVSTARSLLKGMQVPSYLWGEAVKHSVYLLNRLPTKSVAAMTPFEAWTGRKPHLAHVRVFGCTAHVKTCRPTLRKLDDRSSPMVYIGVEEGSKAHRLYDPIHHKLVVSRDVYFDEEKKWNWSVGASTQEEIVHEFTVDGHLHSELREDVTKFNPPPCTPEVSPEASHNNSSSESLSTRTPQNVSSPPRVRRKMSILCSPGNLTPESSDGRPHKFRSLADIYENTEPIEIDPNELMLLGAEEPNNYLEAYGDPKWREAMLQELDCIEKNKTWKLVDLPSGHKPIGLKWVFKLKKDTSGNIIKHKARLVAKGYVQKSGIDVDEVFAPVARIDTVKLIIALAACRNWEVHHLDVKSAFLNGELQEEVYVSQPEGFQILNQESKVYKLNKALYGLRQAPRAWNIRLDKSLQSFGFRRCNQEQAVYIKGGDEGILIVGVYVDDLVVTGEKAHMIKTFKEQMMKEFEMSDLGWLSYYLGIEVKQSATSITLKQSAYASKVLSLFGMDECNETKSPMEQKLKLRKNQEDALVDETEFRKAVGCLRYLTHTRPDMSFSVGVLSRFMQRPSVVHLQALKHILRYLKGTRHHGLIYEKGSKFQELVGFSDSDMAGDLDDGRSTSGMAFYLGNCLITWSSQKQKTVALSSCEAELMAATSAASQALWLRNLLSELVGEAPKPVSIFVDNKSAISLMKNPVFHGRSKHIDTRYHFIRECVERGQIKVEHVRSEEQRADILTKALSRVKFIQMRKLLGVQDVEACLD